MPDFGLPRHCRITGQHDFTRIFAEGKRIRFKGGYVICTPSMGAHARVAVIISKKVCKQAVGRNRMRRLHKECFRTCDKMPAVDVVVVCHKVATHDEVVQQWQNLRPFLQDFA